MNTSTNTAIDQISSYTNYTNNLIQFPSQYSNNTTTKKEYTKYKGNGTVQPIKDKEDIDRAKEYFHDNKEYRYSGTNIRNYCLFVLGINIGRRIGDILNITIDDVIDNSKGKTKIKDCLIIREHKTNKIAKIFLNDNVKEAIDEYLLTLDNYNSTDHLFKTRQSECMTRNQAWKIMNDMGKELELGNLGTHSMRKTFGYQIIQDHKDDNYALATVSDLFNHSSEKITRKYVGIDDDVKRDIYMNLNL